jgi:Plavaka transposase
VTVYDPKDPRTSGVAWFRCPIESLKRQFSKADKGDVYYDPFVELNRAGTRIYNHAMGCKLMEEAVPLIRESIIDGVGGGFWVDRFIFVGAIQAYSDKSCQTLKAGPHAFLPLHLSTLNLTQAVRQSFVSNCDTVVAYLLVDIVMVETQAGNESVHPDDDEVGDEDDDRAPTAGTKTSREERRESRQRLLQKSIEVALKPLRDVARVAFTVVDVDGDVRQCYPALVSYVVGTPEASDIGCTLHSRCPRGYTARPDFASEERCVPRCPHDTLKRLDDLEAAGSAAEVKALEEIKRIVGLTSIRPALLSCPFMELCAHLLYRNCCDLKPCTTSF